MYQNCGNCLFYMSASSNEKGTCRYNPPTVVQVTNGGDGIGAWPRVNASDWCGKHQFEEDDEANDDR